MSLAPPIGNAGGLALSLLNALAIGFRNLSIALIMDFSNWPPTPLPFIFGGILIVGGAPPMPGTRVVPGWRIRLTSACVAAESGAVPANRSRRNVPAAAAFFILVIAAIVRGISASFSVP